MESQQKQANGTEQPPGLFLNLGSSSLTAPGFICLDRDGSPGTLVKDLRLGLPFPNGSTEVVIASHVLEHLAPFEELPLVLAETLRVLRPGGLFRVAVPDLGKLVDAYLHPETELAVALAATQRELREYVGVGYQEMPRALRFSSICFGNNSGSPWYDGHFAALDLEALQWALERAGFVAIQQVTEGESRHPTLMQRYRDTEAPEQIIVEAVKPGEP